MGGGPVNSHNSRLTYDVGSPDQDAKAVFRLAHNGFLTLLDDS